MSQTSQNLLDELPIGAIVLSREQVVRYANDAFIDFIKYPRNELVGMSILEITDSLDRQVLEAGIRELYDGERDFLELETCYIRKDGRRVWGYPVRMLNPRPDDGEADETVLMFVVDITERRELESHMRRTERLNALGLLAASIAHDFRNLLTIIKSLANLMASHTDDPDLIANYAARIDNTCDRGEELSRQLVEFGTEETERIEQIELNEFLRDVHQVFSRLLPSTVNFEISLSEQAPMVMTQRGRLHQIVTNLIVNARDAMQDRGTVRIETEACSFMDPDFPETNKLGPGDYTLLRIQDSGEGIAPENVPKIFDPFFTTKGEEGTGMGLSTVSGIINRDRGYLRVVPKTTEGGACFEIYLPADEETYRAQHRRLSQSSHDDNNRPRFS